MHVLTATPSREVKYCAGTLSSYCGKYQKKVEIVAEYCAFPAEVQFKIGLYFSVSDIITRDFNDLCTLSGIYGDMQCLHLHWQNYAEIRGA